MKDIINITNELIKIPSVSSDLVQLFKVVQYVETFFLKLNNPKCKIEKFEFNNKPSIIIKNFDGKHADVVLNGHLDVVPPSQADQFTPILKDNNLYARGSADMKSGCAVMIYLMKEILESDCSKKVLLMLNTDEEVGGLDGANKLVEQGYGGDVILIPDGGSLQEIVIKEKGVLNLHVLAKGINAHSSRPWLGKNAIETLYKYYFDLKGIMEDPSLYENGHRGTSVNMTVIHGGTAENVIPDKVEGIINFRFIEKHTLETLINKIKEFSKDYDVEIRVGSCGEVLSTSDNNLNVTKYMQSINKILVNKYGIESNLTYEHGASDGRFFSAKGMPVILQKPNGENIHSKDEFVQIDAIEKLYEVYKDYIFSE